MTTKRSSLTRAAAATGAGLGAAAWLRAPARRDRLRKMVVGIRDTLLPQTPTTGDVPPAPPADEAHAPGHKHLATPEQQTPPTQATAPVEHTVVSHHSGHVHKG